jgi:hypothetical protein
LVSGPRPAEAILLRAHKSVSHCTAKLVAAQVPVLLDGPNDVAIT